MSNQNEITYFGETLFRNERRKFGIKDEDRQRHFYIIGKTGMGKTTMLENMVVQDIQRGRGVGVIDPHGEFAEHLLDFVPKQRINDVIYFNPADIDFPIGFNIMENLLPEQKNMLSASLMGVFKKIWPDVWSARMEYILSNTILALLDFPNATLLSCHRMLSDQTYRKKVVEKIKDPVVKSFWVKEYANYTQSYEIEAKAAIQNKIGQFIATPIIRNIIGQIKSTINMRKIMDEEKILIVNISKGRIGEENTRLLGALIATNIQCTAMTRVNLPEEKRKNFFLYIDEFQNFATESFINTLSEARKYHLCLILAHQYVNQMEEPIRDAVFGNVGTIVCFRIGALDAQLLEKEFEPELSAQDLVDLPKYNFYLKLMINGITSRPFSAVSLPPPIPLEKSYRKEIIASSRRKFSYPREKVEARIAKEVEAQGLNITNTLKKPSFYTSFCSVCGRKIVMHFKPDKKKSVYCDRCHKRLVKEKEKEEEHLKMREIKEEGFVYLDKNLEKKIIPLSPSLKNKVEVKEEEVKKAIEETLKNKKGD